MDQRYVTGKKPVSSSPARGASGQGRHNFLYHDHGLSSYNANSYYEKGDQARYSNHELDRFENLENCRAHLLQKLDELKDHLSRSCEVTEKPGQRMGRGMRISPAPALNETYPRNHATYAQEGFPISHGVNKQSLVPDDIVYPYLSQAPGFVPYTDTYRSSLRNLHSHRGYSREYLPYHDTYQQEMPRGPYDQPQYQDLHRHCHVRSNGYCGNVNHDLFGLNQDFHKPSCSCVQCFDKNLDLPVDSSCLYDKRSQHVLSNPHSFHNLLPMGNGPQGFSSEGFNLNTSHSQPSITLNSTEQNFGNDGIHRNCARMTEQAHRNVHMLYPVAGGAPFIACSSCFELLKLPRKHISLTKHQYELKCGACSSIILFEVANKALPLPVSGSGNDAVNEMDDFSNLAVDENVGYLQGGSNISDTDACSDSNAYSHPKISPADNKSNSGEFENELDPLSASSFSENLQMPITLTSEKHGSLSEELNAAEVESFQHPLLFTEEFSDHCSANIVVYHCDTGNKSTEIEFECNVSRQSSVRDSAVSTEIDMSSKDFPKSFISLDSVDEIKEQHSRGDRGAESSSAGHVKNSSVDFIKFAESVDVDTSQVFVNWHLIPEHLVQKAELLAGSIQPGDYWYDIRAGFWGVMGYPCLGIIMPNIEEFNYPMPVNCAAGNTGVYVNGRELNQKDLDLLAGRGLPETRQRSYLIDISGEVVDEDTGEELDSIGRLAPTVERVKHGFGMKVPRFISQLQD